MNFLGFLLQIFADRTQNRWLYPFDAEADTLRRWQEVSALVTKELQVGEITPLFAATSATYA